MLYLRSMAISRFKSFKHAELLFSKGFTCIVGPNGSGKSNICDALLFGLGESSLRRLRVEKLEMLINSEAAKSKGSLPKAHVKIELDGDEKIEVLRVARADGKSVFRINGKRMTRQEATEVLKKYRFNVDETNTITQGEINKMMELNPKERRELIDIAAGIKEFEDKKAESMKELDKVSVKIGEAQIMLNERLGFLKELEKEKTAAEEFARLSQRKKLLSYSILSLRKEMLQEEYDAHAKEAQAAERKRQEIEREAWGIKDMLSRLSGTRQELSKKLNENTIATGDTSRRIEALGNESSALGVELENYAKGIEEAKEFIENANLELAKIRERIKSGNDELAGNSRRLGEIETPEADAGDAGKIEELEAEAKRLGAERDMVKVGIQKIDADMAAAGARLEEIKKAGAESSKRLEDLTKSKKGINGEIEILEKQEAEFKEKIGETEKSAGKLQRELEDANSKLIEMKEQIAISASRESSLEGRIASAFDAKKGFYGKASSLCSYDPAYALAVDASSRSRLDYFIVDRIETASTIIDYLKKNGLGRATFIPLEEIGVGSTKAESDLSPLISFIKFDEKYRKAFEYIFGNTYITTSIDEAKAHGVGKRRYVTLDGEIVEQSGIVSGGYSKRIPLAVLENSAKGLESRRKGLGSALDSCNSQLFELRKQAASVSIKLASKRSELGNINALISQELSSVSSREAAVKGLEGEISAKAAERANLASNLAGLEKQIEENEKRVRGFYEASIALSRSSAANARRKELAKEAERLKLRNAELKKEAEMLSEREKEIGKEVAEKKAAIENYTAESAAKKARLEKLAKQRSELEEELMSSNSENKKAYEQLESIEKEIAEASAKQGRLNAELESVNRRNAEIEIKKSQIETKLADIEAERQAYTDVNGVLSGSIEAMEKEIGEIGTRIYSLGTINMKAPEIYVERKKEADEAQQKLETLSNERAAIMKMIDEIDSKKQRVFLETFNAVNKNFSKFYNYIFPGTASIELENPKDIFNSGLYIRVVGDNGSKRIDSLSGGEKSLIMLMLIFSIRMSKLSSLYVFDEVDMALDKENSRKLSLLIKEMSKDSQFILVSHNDSLISNADTAIGVARSNGESRAVGIQVSSILNRNK